MLINLESSSGILDTFFSNFVIRDLVILVDVFFHKVMLDIFIIFQITSGTGRLKY